MLRTEELAAVHRVDGAEQYFTRAVDFGYSFSVEETFERWGRQEILGDFVRLIRMTRPDVIATMALGGTAGGLHHQGSALLTKDAFRAAGDPTQFPEQLHDGLRPWQARKLYTTAGFGRGAELPAGVRSVTIDTSRYDALLGSTYQELGSFARSMHKCQGMAQLLALPGMSSVSGYLLADTTIAGQADKDERSLFDGVDTSIEGLSRYAGQAPPVGLTEGLAAIASHARQAQSLFEHDGMDAVLSPLVAGLEAVRALRSDLARMRLEEAAQFEIDARLGTKQQQFEEAIVAAANLRLEALADDGVIVGGQPIKATIIIANRGAATVEVRRVDFDGFDAAGPSCAGASLGHAAVFNCQADLRVPADARPTGPYWKRLSDVARYEFEPDAPFGLPFRPTPFQARVVLSVGGSEVPARLPVEFRYEGNIFSGEKRAELHVVPRFAVRLTPQIGIIPRPTSAVLANRGAPDSHVQCTARSASR